MTLVFQPPTTMVVKIVRYIMQSHNLMHYKPFLVLTCVTDCDGARSQLDCDLPCSIVRSTIPFTQEGKKNKSWMLLYCLWHLLVSQLLLCLCLCLLPLIVADLPIILHQTQKIRVISVLFHDSCVGIYILVRKKMIDQGLKGIGCKCYFYFLV